MVILQIPPPHSNSALTHPIEVEGVNKQWHSSAPPTQESSCSFPFFSVLSLSFVCCSEALHAALSGLAGVIALSYMYI